jgi:outer membrane receptor for ferrienterochelin and colicins
VCLFVLLYFPSAGQQLQLTGRITNAGGKAVRYAAVGLSGTSYGTQSDQTGSFTLTGFPPGTYTLIAIAPGFSKFQKIIELKASLTVAITLKDEQSLNEVVVTGTMREMSKDDSPVNIDVVGPALLRRTSNVNLFEATSLVNGVKPQFNCNVCNTGDIHINGLEGPYTLILIDGMPIVSGLSSVYGLMGIPVSMIERLEIAKGPASSLYGTEAMGGTINLITKKPAHAPLFYAEYTGSSYLENNLDVSARFKWNKNITHLSGINIFYFDKLFDVNHDGFTDVALQKRVSLFNKVGLGEHASVALRYVFEDRWGGQVQWQPRYRGTDSVYGESILTNRLEFLGKLTWPGLRNVNTQVSYNIHDQVSWYGTKIYNARQSTAFAQTAWNKQVRRHELLAGVAYKNLWYDDNTPVTASAGKNLPDNSHTAGMFLQDEIAADSAGLHKFLLGVRVDYNNVYKWIPSPRLAYKWTPGYRFTARVNFGTGFRIVNVFTEDHAALTGSREVVFLEKIRPEQSYNGSLNTVARFRVGRGSVFSLDATAFYYHFTNKIFADYDADPTKVIYNNLNGFAFSRGLSLNATLSTPGSLKIICGIAYNDVQNVTTDTTGKLHYSQQVQAPLWSGNFIAGYEFPRSRLKVDITANWYGPQRLPVLPDDFRPEFSPWFCLMNLQATKSVKKRTEIFVGVKNLFNFIPSDPIMRPHDPFDKRITDVQDNPKGYTFDTGYNYAPMQGIRLFAGFRYTLQD